MSIIDLPSQLTEGRHVSPSEGSSDRVIRRVILKDARHHEKKSSTALLFRIQLDQVAQVFQPCPAATLEVTIAQGRNPPSLPSPRH